MATFNNPNYAQYMPQQTPAYMLPQAQTVSPMIWVKGSAQAESYPVQPNNTVILWDSEQDTIYIKSTDVLGKPSIKYLDYTIRENSPKVEEKTQQPAPDYVTKSDLIEFMNQVTAQINQLKPKTDRKFKED